MILLTRLTAAILLFSITTSPVFAQGISATTSLPMATTTATTTSPAAPAASSGGGGSLLLGLGIAAGIGVGAYALSTALTGTSFGGRITVVTPCANGAIWVTIVPAGTFQPFYIWTPGTITYSAGPPSHPGQEILGLADIPYVCYIPPFTLLYGQRMKTVGTSPI